MIELQGVEKRFGKTIALKELDLKVGEGQLVGIVGPNGAGKTTALRLIAGFYSPDSGRVLLGGVDVQKERGRAVEHLGYLAENAPAYPEMLVRTYLAFRYRVKKPKNLRNQAIKKEVLRVAEATNVADCLERPIGVLSRGYKQRVALADALLNDPPLLILDEPLVGLDPVQTRDFRDLIAPFRGTKTVVFSSHRLLDVEKLADRLVLISDGRIVGDGTVSELRSLAGAEESDDIEDVFVRLVTKRHSGGVC